MRCWKGTDTPGGPAGAAWRSCVILTALLLTSTVQAAEIAVRHASAKVVGGDYRLDARIEFTLDDDIRNALEHGVQVDVDVFVEVRRERKWLWDPLITKSRLRFSMQNHPLSNDYLVTEGDSGERHQFASAEDGLKFIGNISNYRLLGAEELDPDEGYIGFIRAELNVETLPSPLQPIAYVSGYWRTKGAWYEWVLR